MTTKLTLSPEAQAALQDLMPLGIGRASYGPTSLRDKDGYYVGEIYLPNELGSLNAELAAFIAALVNAALTPDPGPRRATEAVNEPGQGSSPLGVSAARAAAGRGS